MPRPWVLAGAGLAGFALLTWYAGPLLTLGTSVPLADPAVRALVIAGFVAQYLLQKFWEGRRARQRNEQIVERLLPAAVPATAPDAEKLRERFATALQVLRTARFGREGGSWSSWSWKFGRQYLYELPWYMIIGAPGAGKTTALLHSGLRFPLEPGLGRGSIKGYGGTRNCDWWFAEQAVLIDTAGRYTTHESDAVADRLGWETFLDLLRRSRPRRPLNGVLLALSAADLLQADSAQGEQQARRLRARLDELHRTLGLALPVYVLVTKCDLLPGFVEWFAGLGREEREQVWGVGFDPGLAPTAAAAAFAGEYGQLVQNLYRTLGARLEAERDVPRRARLLALPRALRSLQAPLGSTLQALFGAPAPGAAAPAGHWLRGVYLTSGMQEGTPIDRLLSAFGRELGLAQRILPPNQNTGKSFFLARALREGVFAEAELAGSRPALRRARGVLLAGLWMVLLLGSLGVGTAWWRAAARTLDDIEGLSLPLERVVQTAGETPPEPGQVRSALAALDAARTLARDCAAAAARPGDIGARARAQLAAASAHAYDRQLRALLQPAVAATITGLLRGGADANLQYEALKASAMLEDPTRFDAAALRGLVLLAWDQGTTPPLEPTERAALAAHLDALLATGVPGLRALVEPNLMSAVRTRLQAQSDTQRLQTRLDAWLAASDYADFTVPALGSAAALFARRDAGAPSVPGRYTRGAFDAVARTLPAMAQQLAAEAPWVLGTAAQDPGAATDAAVAAVLGRYREQHARAWAAFLDALRPAPDAITAQNLRALAADDGPLTTLVQALAAQAPGPLEAAPNNERASAAALQGLQGFASAGADAPLSLPRARQDFSELARLRAMAQSGALSADAAARLADRVQALRQAAQRDPEPVRSLLLLAAALPAAGTTDGAEHRPGDGVPAAGSPSTRPPANELAQACGLLVPGRFPFARGAAKDISLQDFSALFAPQGRFDQAFGRLPAGAVDKETEPRSARDPRAGPSATDLQSFEAAARIREVFFGGGRREPQLRLGFTPLDLDPGVDRITLTIDGQSVRYAHGPLRRTLVTWPGTQGEARITVEPAPATAPAPAFDGPWALFRLLDRAAVAPGSAPGHYTVVFTLEGRQARFDVDSDAGVDPFRLPALERFTCPGG